MVLGKLPVPGHPTIWVTVGQGVIGWRDGAGLTSSAGASYLFGIE